MFYDDFLLDFYWIFIGFLIDFYCLFWLFRVLGFGCYVGPYHCGSGPHSGDSVCYVFFSPQ